MSIGGLSVAGKPTILSSAVAIAFSHFVVRCTMPKKYDKRGFRYKSLVKKKRRKTVRKPQQDLNEPGCSTGQEENTSKSDDGCDELMMDSSIAEASLQEEGKLNPSIDWSSLEDESMIYDNSAGDESVKILGRRVIEISHCFRELQRFRHTDYFSCGISDVEIMKEKRSGLFSSFYLMCRMCKSNVWVSTDSLEKMGPNTAAVAGVLAIGVGHRQTEEFMAALDIPFMAQKTWQKIEQTEVAKFVEGAALEEMLAAGREEAAIARELGEIDGKGFPLVPVITDGTWAKRSYGTKYNSLSRECLDNSFTLSKITIQDRKKDKRGKRRDGRRLAEAQYSQTPPDTGQEKCKSAQELFELLERVQSSRLDDQRCVLPAYFSQSSREERRLERSDSTCSPSRELLERLLEKPGPYPNLVLPPAGYWSDTGESTGGQQPPPPAATDQQTASPTGSTEPHYYRLHFLGQEHSNFTGWDEALGPVLLSLKAEPNEDQARALLRLRTGTQQALIPSATTPPLTVAKAVCPELCLSSLEPVLAPRASRLIAAYDEHSIVRQYKFGVLLQRFGQVTEEELFSNRTACPAFEEFLACLGSRINLKYHKGYRGGLDTQFGQTGDEAVYQVHKGAEIIFHVSTLLPYTENDPQQLQRKRHIGNDIVAIVFQEKNTPFCPDMIASHFLHSFIVVQAIEPNSPNTRYRVSVTARDDVPSFGPPLPSPPVFKKGHELREFLLDKLISAESACYKAHKFAQLELRTRSSLLESLVTELKEKSREFVGSGAPEDFSSETPKSEGGPGSRFIDTVRKALIARVRSQEVKKQEQDASVLSSNGTHPVSRSSTFGKKSSPSSPVSSPDIHSQRINRRVSESDCSSLNSVELENNDSDTGLESMSSSENNSNKPCNLCLADPLSDLSAEVTRLKCDKLQLLRQNVSCQREIKRLREKELSLQSELANASREILRLRELLKDYNNTPAQQDTSNV